MGPLFAIGLFAIVFALVSGVGFLIAKRFLGFFAAVRLSLISTAAGATGTIVALFAQTPFYPETLTAGQPLMYLGVAALAGIVAAALACWITIRATRRI